MRFTETSKWKSLLCLIGFALLITSVMFSYLLLLLPQKLILNLNKVEFSTYTGFPYSCRGCEFGDNIVIQYPEKMKINESAVVEVTLISWGNFNPKIEGCEGFGSKSCRLRKPLELTLAGAAFSVTPSSKLKKPKGTSIPIIWRWSISPTKEGRQELVLDLENIDLYNIYGGLHMVSVKVNGKKRNFNEYIGRNLSIIVLTKEGITLGAYLIIRYGIGLLGFILLYPAVAGAITQLIKSRKKKESRIIFP